VDRERESPPTAVGAATSASRAGRNLSEEKETLLLLLLPPSSFISSFIVASTHFHRRHATRVNSKDEKKTSDVETNVLGCQTLNKRLESKGEHKS
jgi:hypothetical protein